jgi:ATP-dependent DNA ligase
MLARGDGLTIRLFTRNGHDWTERFPLIKGCLCALFSACPARSPAA